MSNGDRSTKSSNKGRATSGDAAEIANVHLNSWRETYQGLLFRGISRAYASDILSDE